MGTIFDIPPLSTAGLYQPGIDLHRPSRFWPANPREILPQLPPIGPLQLPRGPKTELQPIAPISADAFLPQIPQIPQLDNQFTSTLEDVESRSSLLPTSRTWANLDVQISELSAQSSALVQDCEAHHSTIPTTHINITNLQRRLDVFSSTLKSAISTCASALNGEPSASSRGHALPRTILGIRRELRLQLQLMNSPPPIPTDTSSDASPFIPAPVLRRVHARYPSLAHHSISLSLCRRALRPHAAHDTELISSLDSQASAVLDRSALRGYLVELGDIALLLDGRNVMKLKDAHRSAQGLSVRQRKDRLLERCYDDAFGVGTFVRSTANKDRDLLQLIGESVNLVPAALSARPETLRHIVSDALPETLRRAFTTLSAVLKSTETLPKMPRKAASRTAHALHTRQMTFLSSLLSQWQMEIADTWQTLIAATERSSPEHSIQTLRTTLAETAQKIAARLLLDEPSLRGRNTLIKRLTSIAAFSQSQSGSPESKNDAELRQAIQTWDSYETTNTLLDPQDEPNLSMDDDVLATEAELALNRDVHTPRPQLNKSVLSTTLPDDLSTSINNRKRRREAAADIAVWDEYRAGTGHQGEVPGVVQSGEPALRAVSDNRGVRHSARLAGGKQRGLRRATAQWRTSGGGENLGMR